MLSEFLDLEGWAQWFAQLDREFIFLLALPFVVAIIGLWSAWTDRELEERGEEAIAPRAAGEQRTAPERRRRAQRGGDVGGVARHGSR